MKDFIKWLGVNEKIAKVAVWLLIIMVFLIVFNLSMESMGFSNYQINYSNIKEINSNLFLEYLINWTMIFLNFYAITLLIFPIKEFKKIAKYAVIYLIINIMLSNVFNIVVVQIFIILYVIIFSYLFSKKNKKYILYSIISIIFTAFIETIWYISKIKMIDYTELNELTKSLLSLDYFIIIGIIILVKEIYIKKRGEKNGTLLSMDRGIPKRRKTSQENSKKSK